MALSWKRALCSAALASALVLFLVPLQACSSLSEKEKIALDGYKQNSKAYYTTGKYREAIHQCRRGLEIDEDDYSLNLNLAWALLKSGEKQNIFAAFDQFKSMDKPDWFWHDWLVFLFLADEEDYKVTLGIGQTCCKIATEFGKQIDRYTWKIESEPATIEIFGEKIKECEERKAENLDKAIQYLKRTLAMERQKENVDAILTLGQAYAYRGKPEMALETLGHGISLLDKSTSFHQKRLEKEKNLNSNGQRYFQKTIRRNLKLEQGLRGILAFVYRLQGDNEKALEQYSLLYNKGLFNDSQHYNRGITLQALGRYEEAIRDFELFLGQASMSGKSYDEDPHFHMAFDNIKTCREAVKTQAGNASTPAEGPLKTHE